MSFSRPIRVLIVDDSALVRKMLTVALAGDKQIEIVGTAPDAFIARDKILALNPDVITLDIEMPRMDGITFLKKLMKFRPIPVIIISSLGHAGAQASIDALHAGAVEILCKPSGPYSIGELGVALAEKIRTAAVAHVAIRIGPDAISAEKCPVKSSEIPNSMQVAADRIIAIGASTGGPAAVAEVLSALPPNCPPVLVVQHMPAGFTAHFADRLNRSCRIEVKEAADGDLVRPGCALVAPGSLHMTLGRSNAGYYVKVSDAPPVCFSRPSVDVLFTSVADIAGEKAVGVLLTGMGTDGARGLFQMRTQGGFTIAQDEDSCVVFGMPREAIRLRAAQAVLPLNRIASAIERHSAQSVGALTSKAN